jgi:hypothetical protein
LLSFGRSPKMRAKRRSRHGTDARENRTKVMRPASRYFHRAAISRRKYGLIESPFGIGCSRCDSFFCMESVDYGPMALQRE